MKIWFSLIFIVSLAIVYFVGYDNGQQSIYEKVKNDAEFNAKYHALRCNH